MLSGLRDPSAEPQISPANRSAVGAAGMRALHLVRDGEPKIFVDRFARDLGGWSNDADLLQDASGGGLLTGQTTQWVVRARLVEDRLGGRWEEGTRQYVILGAGLDSFAWRRLTDFPGLTVFEVDQPAMQDWKRWRLQALGLAVPPHLRFVPCNFEDGAVARDLHASGFDPARPSLVSWLAVTPYLTADAIAQTFTWFAGLAPGSELIFTYMDRKAGWAHEAQERRDESAAGHQHRPRAFRVTSTFTRLAMRRLMADAGLHRFRFIAPDELEQHYLRDRTDGLTLSGWERLVIARPGEAKDPKPASAG